MTYLLFITERFPPLPGGMAVSAHRQVTSLRKRGMVVDVLVFHSLPGQKDIALHRLEKDGGTDILVSHDDQFGNAAQRAYREIYERNAQHPYHVVMGFGACFPGYFAVTCAAFMGLPSLVSVRGNDFDRDWFEPKRGYFVREALSRACRIAAVSREKVSKIKALFPDKPVFFCPNGLDAGGFELLPVEKEESRAIRKELNGQGQRIIGLFGELKYKKQVPAFLAAIRESGLKDKVSLLIAGHMNEECQALIDDPGLSPRSRHVSFREPESLPPLYAACDFMAIPSLFEGFPNVLLEAMAAGAVPIVSGAGAMGDVIEHGKTGFILDPLDRAQSTQVMREAMALGDKDLNDMKSRVKAYVKTHFTPEKEADVLEAEILKTVSKACRI